MASSLVCKPFTKPHSLIRIRSCVHFRCEHSVALADEKSMEVQYPRIKGKFPPGKWGSLPSKLAWRWEQQRETLSKMNSHLEKIQYLSMGYFKTWKFPVIQLSPRLLKYQLAVTKTHHIANGLPVLYKSVNVEEDVKKLKSSFIEMLEMEHYLNNYKHKNAFSNRNVFLQLKAPLHYSNEQSKTRVRHILLNIHNALQGNYPYIYDSHINENVPVAAFWYRDGIKRGNVMKPGPKSRRPPPENNAHFYGEHFVDFQIQRKEPLPKFLPRRDSLCSTLTYDRTPLEYSPRVLGQFCEHVKRQITPGFNIDDPCHFVPLSFVMSDHRYLLRVKQQFSDDLYLEDKVGYGLVTSFLSSVAQAHYQGFNDYEELTQPITTQTIVTNGQEFIFQAFQLNTIQLWKPDDANTNQNVMWSTAPMRLYESVDDHGKLIGFNEETFQMLLKFMLIPPRVHNLLSSKSSPNDKTEYIPTVIDTQVISAQQ